MQGLSGEAWRNSSLRFNSQKFDVKWQKWYCIVDTMAEQFPSDHCLIEQKMLKQTTKCQQSLMVQQYNKHIA